MERWRDIDEPYKERGLIILLMNGLYCGHAMA